MKKIFVLTGEPSGDKLASEVISHLKTKKSVSKTSYSTPVSEKNQPKRGPGSTPKKTAQERRRPKADAKKPTAKKKAPAKAKKPAVAKKTAPKKTTAKKAGPKKGSAKPNLKLK